MNYQIGDPVIHLTDGPVKIVAIEDKRTPSKNWNSSQGKSVICQQPMNQEGV